MGVTLSDLDLGEISQAVRWEIDGVCSGGFFKVWSIDQQHQLHLRTC
jgi:hypothetical protein